MQINALKLLKVQRVKALEDVQFLTRPEKPANNVTAANVATFLKDFATFQATALFIRAKQRH